MERTDRRVYFKISGAVALIAVLDGVLLALGKPTDIHRAAPNNIALTLITDGSLIAIGIAIQLWLRNKPQYRLVRFVVYALTLAVCMAVCLATVAWLAAGHG